MFLEAEKLVGGAEPRRVGLRGIQSGAAGRRDPLDGRRDGGPPPALGGVQDAVVRPVDQQVGFVRRVAAFQAFVSEVEPVVQAGEDDGEVPRLLPGSSELLVKRGAVT